MQTTSEYTVRVKLRDETEFREYPNAVSWGLENGIASVANGERVNCWPLELIEEWDVPRISVSEGEAAPQESPVEDDDAWYQV